MYKQYIKWSYCEGVLLLLVAIRSKGMGRGLSLPDLQKTLEEGRVPWEDEWEEGEDEGEKRLSQELSGKVDCWVKKGKEMGGGMSGESKRVSQGRRKKRQRRGSAGAALDRPPTKTGEDNTFLKSKSTQLHNNPPHHGRVRTPSVVVSDFSVNVEESVVEGGWGAVLGEGWDNHGGGAVDESVLGLGTGCQRCWLPPPRKLSSASTCSSTLSDEDFDPNRILEPPPQKKPSGWRKLRNIVQWTPFFQIYKKQRYPWVQLAGHQGNFRAGPEPGTILKKLCPKEQLCFQALMRDVLRAYVPQYKGHVTCEEAMFLQLQDLLSEFTNPCVMDCKIGVRTYLEEELAKAKENPKLRKDMYEKMVQIDSNAPTEEEHRLKGVTKPRYMVWRETISSTATLGFRIEGVKKSDGKSSKDFKTTKSREQVIQAFTDFTEGFPHAVPKYIQRLKAIKATLEVSTFFNTHEMIGSSLLFVHDDKLANVWLIDFAKTMVLPNNVMIDHLSPWVVGNHEDGYLLGLNNLIDIFTEMAESLLTSPLSPPTATLLVDPPPPPSPPLSSHFPL